MIGNALRMDIEVYAGQFDRKALMETTRAGKMTRDMITRYMTGLHFLLTLTPVHLTKARERARALGDENLAAHFQHKLEEEVGHDAWAENDLRRLDSKRPPRADLMDSAKALARFIESTIDEHPALYLAYIAFVEYVTVIKGPEWLALLEERCGVPRASMSAVGNHVELDRDHAEEGFAVMDDLVTDPRMLPAMRDALARAMAHFDAYCVEATTAAPADEITTSHVSAA
jgi:hypothetical protein